MKLAQKLTCKQFINSYPPSDFSFNMYISSDQGMVGNTFIGMYTNEKIDVAKRADDWCYVYNFLRKDTPKALVFDAGDGRRFKDDISELVSYITQEIPYIYSTQELETEDLRYERAIRNVACHIKRLKQCYPGYKDAQEYIDNLNWDIMNNIEFFREKEKVKQLVRKYDVNLLVDNSENMDVPIVTGYNLTYNKMIGKLEYDNEFGFFSTDYMKIKPGLFHKANGGYLILEAYDILRNPGAWEAIRRVLKTGFLHIEDLEGGSVIGLSSINPEPIPINVKVILIGDSKVYSTLYKNDLDFRNLFKLRVDLKDINV